jgi:hypothetical protein
MNITSYSDVELTAKIKKRGRFAFEEMNCIRTAGSNSGGEKISMPYHPPIIQAF